MSNTKEENQIVDLLKKNNGYIKGDGQVYSRVMTENHHPLYKCLKSDVESLLIRGVLYRDGLIVKLKK